ncbi:LysR substrate-binding domain-containing protein [Azospirillum sp. TSO22-1]|uniref:LysR substrate-binding domain-containing protein n=1 Tax=Azospirillum sp. TSO22-1 TaxID=716789 RepID=UPI000D61B365|nr:LysR substrate-binding domain-containing protein [Azospirillum sp. TSO22-1]PWC56967.1 LysR family transcriptional regulator [Azospirillum sp. TSO22-1]
MIEAVTLRQLRYLVSVADTLHFGRAAERCHVSQPSLSAQIQQLEDVLGVQLVERTQRRVLLTPAGRDAVTRARRILGEMSDLAAAARSAATPLGGELRLGAIPTLAPYYLPRVLPDLRHDHPDLKLFLREDLTGRLLDLLKAGALDAVLLALPVDEPGLEHAAVFDEPFAVALPAGHPLAARPALTERDLGGERLLLLEEGHCFRDQALAVCHRAGGPDRDGFSGTSLATLCEMVAGRIGVTLLPELARARAPEGVETRPFAEPRPARRLGLAWRKGSPRGAELQQLAAYLRRHLPDGVAAAE